MSDYASLVARLRNPESAITSSDRHWLHKDAADAIEALTQRPVWWCCSAGYPNHDANCATGNLQAEVAALRALLKRTLVAVKVSRFYPNLEDEIELFLKEHDAVA
jgi:hypothetical protein